MSKVIQIHSGIRVGGSMILGKNLTDFPANPEIGQTELVNHGLYSYIDVGGVVTWYPLVKAPDSFKFEQTVAAQEWIVPHNLNTESIWYQIQEDGGQIMLPADIIIVDDNTVKFEFGEPVTGRVLILATGGERGQAGERGVDGASAYQLAVENGYVGTVTQWLASLKGADGVIGSDGLSAYEIAQSHGYAGTEAQWLTSLQGAAGADGANGKSAYQLALDGGFVGTQQQYLDSLKGAKGDTGLTGPQGIPGGDSVFHDIGTYSAGGTLTIDYTQGKHQRFQVGAAMSLALANWPTLASGLTGEILLEIQNGAAFSMSWPSVKWLKSDGTFTTTFASSDTQLQANGIDFVLLWTRDGGATVYGKVMR